MNNQILRCLAPVLLLLLAACNGQPAKKATSQPEAAAASVPQQGTFVHDSVQIAYTMAGTADTTLLFVHGWCINKSFWQAQVAAFSQQYKVVALDLPGHGQSGSNRTNFTMQAYGQDVVALINHLQLTNVVLVGHSMGGDIILEAALSKPEAIAGFVGVDNFKDVKPAYTPQEEQGIAQLISMLKQNYQQVAVGFSSNFLFQPSTDSLVRQNVTQAIANANPEVSIAALEAVLAYAAQEPAKLQQLKHKLYLINSDAIPNNEAALEQYCAAGHGLLNIGPTGHYPMNERPAQFNKLLKNALAGIASQK